MHAALSPDNMYLRFFSMTPAPDPGPRELRPLCYHPAAVCALTLRQTRPGTPWTPFLEAQALAAGKTGARLPREPGLSCRRPVCGRKCECPPRTRRRTAGLITGILLLQIGFILSYVGAIEEAVMNDPLRVRVSGPLAGYAPGLRAELAARGYPPGTGAREPR